MSEHPPLVLLVEDEESYVEALTVALTKEGFRVEVARDGADALTRFDAMQPDLVLLDLMLPKVPGIDVCRRLRARTDVPIVIVTARDAEIDTVVGLEVGADDYVSKPFRVRELVARMRAVLRRAAPRAAEAPADGDVLRIGEVSLDPDRHEVTVGGRPVHLPLREFELLEVLMSNAGRVMPRGTLIRRVWGHDYTGDTNTLDVHVKRIRARIEDDPARPARITTVRGLGYRFESPRRS